MVMAVKQCLHFNGHTGGHDSGTNCLRSRIMSFEPLHILN